MRDLLDKNRCGWVITENPRYVAYHDEEWGVAVYDDKTLFEFLILEGAQAGLSWSTILNKREGYREAFDNFEVERVARFTKRKVESLLKNPAIVRNRLKVESAVRNAKAFIKIQNEFESFSNYQWQFVRKKPLQNKWKNLKEVPTTTKESDALSKDLKKRGFQFVGSTIIYAHMQATGMVNDHTIDCFRHKQIQQLLLKR